MNGSLPRIMRSWILKKGLQVMAYLRSRARYVWGSAGGRRAARGNGRNWRVACVIIFAVLVSLRSFFFRQLFSALLLFTVIFVVAAALIALFIGIGYAVDSALFWTQSQVRSMRFSMHHSVTLSALVSSGETVYAMRRFKKLNHN